MLPAVLNEMAVTDLLPQVDVQKTLWELFAALTANNAVQPAQTLTLFPNDALGFGLEDIAIAYEISAARSKQNG